MTVHAFSPVAALPRAPSWTEFYGTLVPKRRLAYDGYAPRELHSRLRCLASGHVIMNQMNAGVYITDVDTDEILFMNSGMKKQFGLVEPEGKNLLAGASKRDERALSLLPRAASAAGRPLSEQHRSAGREHNTSNRPDPRRLRQPDSMARWPARPLSAFAGRNGIP